MVYSFTMPGSGPAYVPSYLRANTSIPATSAGEANRFRNLAATTAAKRTPAPTTVAGVVRSQGATTGEATRFANLPGAPTMAQLQQAGGATAGEAQRFANAAAAASVRAPQRQTTTTAPTQTSTSGGSTGGGSTRGGGPVQTTPEPAPVPVVTEPGPGDVAPAPAPEPTPYSVYDDPFYQQALATAQSQFNLARADALAGNQYQQRGIERQLEERIPAAEQARRRLAGNFAARGMGGGRYGALTRAEAEMNAREISARTGLREQIAELNRQFTSRFGAEGTDWLGTRAGYEAQQAAIQQALQNRLAGLTTVG